MFTTATIPLNFGNKKLYTTVTSAIGVTTVTEYEQETKTVSPAAANGFQPQLAAAVLIAGIAQQSTVGHKEGNTDRTCS